MRTSSGRPKIGRSPVVTGRGGIVATWHSFPQRTAVACWSTRRGGHPYGRRGGPQSPEAERTPTFHVSATWTPSASHRHRSHGRGKLLITPSSIVFYPSDETPQAHGRRRFGGHRAQRHHDDSTDAAAVVEHFLAPTRQTSPKLVRASLFARHKLRRALQQSGVTVHEKKSWRAPHLLPASAWLPAGTDRQCLGRVPEDSDGAEEGSWECDGTTVRRSHG